MMRKNLNLKYFKDEFQENFKIPFLEMHMCLFDSKGEWIYESECLSHKNISDSDKDILNSYLAK